jgi:hypothetical protein
MAQVVSRQVSSGMILVAKAAAATALILLVGVVASSCKSIAFFDSFSDMISGRRKLGLRSSYTDTGYPNIRSLNNNKSDGKIPIFVETEGSSNGNDNRKISDIRFNKCPPIVESDNHTDMLQLLPADYPLANVKAVHLKTETMADSVITPDDYQVFGAKPEEWMSLLKPPSYPLRYAKAPYWNELRQVIRAQMVTTLPHYQDGLICGLILIWRILPRQSKGNTLLLCNSS